jgi:plastocyanin
MFKNQFNLNQLNLNQLNLNQFNLKNNIEKFTSPSSRTSKTYEINWGYQLDETETNITIVVGDTVRFITNTSHNITFNNSDIGVLSNNSYTFNDPGIYDYYCSNHDGMVETIIVISEDEFNNATVIDLINNTVESEYNLQINKVFKFLLNQNINQMYYREERDSRSSNALNSQHKNKGYILHKFIEDHLPPLEILEVLPNNRFDLRLVVEKNDGPEIQFSLIYSGESGTTRAPSGTTGASIGAPLDTTRASSDNTGTSETTGPLVTQPGQRPHCIHPSGTINYDMRKNDQTCPPGWTPSESGTTRASSDNTGESDGSGSSEQGDSFPTWAIVLIVIGIAILLLLSGLGMTIIKRDKK